MKMSDFINDIPYLSPAVVGKELYNDYQNVAQWLSEAHRGVVTGLWYIHADAEDDGGLQCIVRLTDGLTAAERCEIHVGIWDRLPHGHIYTITDNDTSRVDMQLDDDSFPMFFPESIYCIFDNNRH